MHGQLLGTTQPVLSISLEPGETIVGGSGEFSWMTDSIQMSTDADAVPPDSALRRTLDESSLALSAYTARQVAGTIAFAAKLPGSILSIEVTPGSEYLVHRRGFLAGTPGITVTTGYLQPYEAGDGRAEEELLLRRIAGRGTAWVELSGDVVRRYLPAGASLRTHPWHIGMFDASVVVQMAELRGIGTESPGTNASRFAVLSGPGAVWLQATPPHATRQPVLAARPPAPFPALEGGAGGVPDEAVSHIPSTHDRG
jgi:uncharacterized protein (AIM24 family)